MPFALFWEMTRGEKVADPAAIVPRLVPDVLTKEQAACTLEFDRLTRLPYMGREDRIARDIIAIYDGFYHALFTISEKTRELEGNKHHESQSTIPHFNNCGSVVGGQQTP